MVSLMGLLQYIFIGAFFAISAIGLFFRKNTNYIWFVFAIYAILSLGFDFWLLIIQYQVITSFVEGILYFFTLLLSMCPVFLITIVNDSLRDYWDKSTIKFGKTEELDEEKSKRILNMYVFPIIVVLLLQFFEIYSDIPSFDPVIIGDDLDSYLNLIRDVRPFGWIPPSVLVYTYYSTSLVTYRFGFLMFFMNGYNASRAIQNFDYTFFSARKPLYKNTYSTIVESIVLLFNVISTVIIILNLTGLFGEGIAVLEFGRGVETFSICIIELCYSINLIIVILTQLFTGRIIRAVLLFLYLAFSYRFIIFYTQVDQLSNYPPTTILFFTISYIFGFGLAFRYFKQFRNQYILV